MAIKLPKIGKLRELLFWAEERQRVFLKREAGEPFPWTKNPIMNSFRFCCTYREDDRVTKWIRQNWREPYKDHENLWFAMLIARQINWPDTLSEIGFPEKWNPHKVLKIMDARRTRSEKVFTSAYMIGGGPTKGYSKNCYIVFDVLDPVWKAAKNGLVWDLPKDTGMAEYSVTLQYSFEWILQFNGWGRFMSYEAITDLRHTRYLCNAPDIMTWANLGPGAIRGINRLYEQDLRFRMPFEEGLERLLLITKWIQENRDTKLLPTWEPRDSEHLFCEFDKMNRAKERLASGKAVGLENFKVPGLV